MWSFMEGSYGVTKRKERKKKIVDEDMKLCHSILHASQDLIITIFLIYFGGLQHYSQNFLVALAMRSTRFLEMKRGVIKHDVLIFIGNFKLFKYCKNLEQTLKTKYKKLCNFINQSIYVNNLLPFCIVGYSCVKFFDGVKCEQHTY
jgi:hypothetical protein